MTGAIFEELCKWRLQPDCNMVTCPRCMHEPAGAKVPFHHSWRAILDWDQTLCRPRSRNQSKLENLLYHLCPTILLQVFRKNKIVYCRAPFIRTHSPFPTKGTIPYILIGWLNEPSSRRRCRRSLPSRMPWSVFLMVRQLCWSGNPTKTWKTHPRPCPGGPKTF